MATKAFVDPDAGKTPKQLYAERIKRYQDVYQLKQPDRIPIQLNMSYLLADMYGITHQEQHENGAKELELIEKAAAHFQADSILGLFNTNQAATLALGDRTTKFPG